ncbi:MAG: hypothetical protein GY874_12210 [Desulfobacteraceae bacterium]|nr:hypothetical protein [Desulfobacteraceae bacterium]
MPLTIEEKEKCSALFELYSSYKHSPNQWNDEAAKALSVMIDKLQNCTIGIAALHAAIPKPQELRGIKGLQDWIKRVSLDILKTTAKTKKNMIVSRICSDAGLRILTTNVRAELMK